MPRVVDSSLQLFPTAVISRSLSAFLPQTSSLPVWWGRLVGAAVVALQAVVPTEECARVALARSEALSAAAVQPHSGWARADCSAELPVNDSARPVDPAGLPADGSIPAGYSAPAGSVGLPAHDSAPADYSAQAGPSEHRCSPDARPVCSPVAELRRVSPERYTASPWASRVQRRGR